MRTARWLVVPTVLTALLAWGTPVGVAEAQPSPPGAQRVKVMTRNLYLGADLTPLLSARTPAELAARAAQAFGAVQATKFPERAKALAAEIEEAEPDVVGLQEVALYRTGEPGVLDGPVTPATTVHQDFLTILTDALRAAGLDYVVAVALDELDVEVPSTLGFDIRLTQRDAVLVRGGVAATGARSSHFRAVLALPTVGGLVTLKRGWTAVDVTVDERTFRFVNTHLEAYSPVHRLLQAAELLLPGGPVEASVPTVLVGDLNSGPAEGPVSAYATLSLALPDTWTRAGRGPGFTCCHAEDLRNEAPTLTRRIDHVLTSADVRAVGTRVVGTDPDARTPSGLWPSDHAGVVATVTP